MRFFSRHRQETPRRGTKAVANKSGIFLRTFALSSLLILGVILIFAAATIPRQKNAILKSLESQAHSVSASIAQVCGNAVVTEDYSFIVEHSLQVVRGSPNILYVGVARREGFTLIHTAQSWTQLEKPPLEWESPGDPRPKGAIMQSSLVGQKVFYYRFPLQYSGLEWGTLHLGLSLTSLDKEIHSMYRIMALLSLLCIGCGITGGYLFARRLTRPILELRDVTRKIAAGDLQARASINTGDEIEDLALSFNHMTHRLLETTVSKNYVDNIIRSMKDSLIVTDTEGRIQTVNRAGLDLLGYAADALTNRPIAMIVDPDAPTEGLEADLSENFPQADSFNNLEQSFHTRDGRKIPVLFSGSVMRDDQGRATGRIYVAVDITERKQAEIDLQHSKEAAESASRAKSEFLANMSHELRTPLNHIIGFTELVVDQNFGEVNATQTEYLNDVLTSSHHLLSLINDILDLSKVEAGKWELEPAEVNLKQLLENSLVMIREKAVKHGIALAAELETAPAVIVADERKLKQIVFNLLSNAVKFTPDGGKITLSAAHCHPAGAREADTVDASAPWVELRVTDSGIGLRPEDIERIFNPFEQAEGALTRRFQGTGLGLSLTRKLVELHGGRVWAESEGIDRGSVFRALMPKGCGNVAGEVGADEFPTKAYSRRTVVNASSALS